MHEHPKTLRKWILQFKNLDLHLGQWTGVSCIRMLRRPTRFSHLRKFLQTQLQLSRKTSFKTNEYQVRIVHYYHNIIEKVAAILIKLRRLNILFVFFDRLDIWYFLIFWNFTINHKAALHFRFIAECQELLSNTGSKDGSIYFVYDGKTMTCAFYDSGLRRCNRLNGPIFPPIQTWSSITYLLVLHLIKNRWCCLLLETK